MAGPDQTSDSPAPDSRVRFELLLALGLLLFGLVVLPALIYLVGTFLLGPYGGGGGRLGSFYGDLMRDLASGSGRAWVLLIGPLLLFQLARLIFSRFGNGSDETALPRNEPKQRPPASGSGSPRPQTDIRERREPTIRF
jgi:hypothetical protein